MIKPSAAQVSELREKIIQWQTAERPRGMPPQAGLLYQPIPFEGFEDLACERNSSEQRFQLLKNTGFYDNAKVLDLGCANGYFLFRLAQEAGMLGQGKGVDYYEANIQGNSAVAELFGLDDRLSFQRAGISEETVKNLLAEQPVDICHILSVHHHLIRTLSMDETKRIFAELWEQVPVFFVEQGSLTQEEYETWTGREEPFTTNAFSRLISMMTACGIPEANCFPVGMGFYLSGNRDDLQGAGRVIIGVARKPGALGTHNIIRKAHKNGVYMELLEIGSKNGGTEVWKNVVTGNGLADREHRALSQLADADNVPKLVCPKQAEQDKGHGMLRLQGLKLHSVTDQDLKERQDLRSQVINHLNCLAQKGMIHNEINELHLLLDDQNRLVLIDFETVYFITEDREAWVAEVLEPNPVLGVGAYPRELHEQNWQHVDLHAVDSLFEKWGLEALNETEKNNYLSALNR